MIFNLTRSDAEITQKTIERLESKSRYLDQKIKRIYNVDLNLPVYIKEIPRQIWGYMLYNNKGPEAIYLNSNVLKDNPDYVINHVLAHEFAHAVERKIYKRKNRSHGKEWKEICMTISDGT